MTGYVVAVIALCVSLMFVLPMCDAAERAVTRWQDWRYEHRCRRALRRARRERWLRVVEDDR